MTQEITDGLNDFDSLRPELIVIMVQMLSQLPEDFYSVLHLVDNEIFGEAKQ